MAHLDDLNRMLDEEFGEDDELDESVGIEQQAVFKNSTNTAYLQQQGRNSSKDPNYFSLVNLHKQMQDCSHLNSEMQKEL